MEKVNYLFIFLKNNFSYIKSKHTSFRFSMKHKEEKSQERNDEKKKSFEGACNGFYIYIYIYILF